VAKRQDLSLVTRADLSLLRKDFAEMVALAKTQGKLVADALSQALSTDVLAGLEKSLKNFKPPKGTGAGGGSTGAPPTRDPAKEEQARVAAAQRAAKAIADAEARGNALRESLSQKTTDELIADMDRLQQKKKAVVAAIATEEDKAAKAQLVRSKKAIDEELAITSERARKRPEVISGGAGAGVGLPGVGRNLIGGLGQDIGASLLTGFSVAGIGAAFAEVVATGSEFDKGLKSLESITGVGGDALVALGTDARNLAKEFGGSASANIESFKGVLSRLGNTLPADQLGTITRSINTLSAATGDDAVASMDALTSSVLQFQVPLDGTVDVGTEAARMMNVLAAGAKFGAAEVPQVADAIKVAGVAASGAKVSFEETNAAIQALAAGGKVGAEAGTALRNVLGKLGEGRFLPKEVQTEFKKAGVDINKLGDTSLSLTDRLRELQKVQGDTALISKLFGTENAAAGSILLRSVDSIDDLTGKLTGTQTAYEQAATNQASFTAGLDRFKAIVSDKAIAAFEALMPALTVGLNLAGDAVAFVADNWKLFLGPIAPIIDGISELVGWVDSLVDSFGHQIDVQKETNAIELDGIEAKKKANAAEQTRQKTIQKLASEYEKLGKNAQRTAVEEKRMAEISVQLNEQYPGLISSTASFNDNLANVKGAANDAQLALRSLSAEMTALDAKQRKIAFSNAQQDINQFGQDLSGALDDIDIDVETFDKQFKAAIQAAAHGTQAQFDDALADLKIDLATPISAALKDGEDVKAARAALAGYTGALQKFFDLRAAATPKKVIPTEDAPPPPGGDGSGTDTEAKEALSFVEKTAEARRKAAALLAEVDIKNASDERARIQATAKEKRRLLTEQLNIDLKKADDDAAAATKEGRKVEGLGAFKDELRRVAKLESDASTDEERRALRDLSQKLLDDELKAANAAASIRKDQAQAELDAEVAQQDALGVVTSDGLRKRLELQRKVRAEERSILIAGLVSQNEEFKKQFEQAQRDFDSGAIDEAGLRKKLGDLRLTFTATAETDVRVKSFDATGTRTDADADREIRLKDRQEAAEKSATSIADLERKLAIDELETRQQLELANFQGTEERKAELLRKFAAERQDIEKSFLEQTNDLFRIANDFRTSLEKAFTVTIDKESEKRLNETRKKNADDLQDLRESYEKGEISTRDYNSQLLKLQVDLRKAESELDQGKLDFPKMFKEASLTFFSEQAKGSLKIAQQNAVDLTNTANARSKRIADEMKKGFTEQEAIVTANKEFEDQIATQRAATYASLAQSLGSTLIQFAIDGHKNIGDFLKVILGSALDFLQTMVPLWSAQILGGSLATPQSVLSGGAAGIAQWLGLTALLSGAVAIAKGAIQGFSKGGYTGDAPASQVVGVVHGREVVVPAGPTAKHRSLLEHIVRGGDPSAFMLPQMRLTLPRPELRYDLSRLEITQAGIRERSEQAYAMAATAHATAGVTNEKLDTVITELSLIRARTKDVVDNTGSTARSAKELAKKPAPKSSGFVG
jgi:TP901 family phage tail tape measure protein